MARTGSYSINPYKSTYRCDLSYCIAYNSTNIVASKYEPYIWTEMLYAHGGA